MILYLLPFTSGTDFKFGITNSDRIKRIDSVYSIDLNKAKIISAKDDHTIRYLEREIKSVFRNFISNKYAGKDGSTEILPMSCWDDVIKLIENRKSSLVGDKTRGLYTSTSQVKFGSGHES